MRSLDDRQGNRGACTPRLSVSRGSFRTCSFNTALMLYALVIGMKEIEYLVSQANAQSTEWKQ